MSPLPREMADRWRSRPEPGPTQAQLYWHILMKDQPEVRALAALARQRLARFRGLHFTPWQWLHCTVLMIGLADHIAAARIDEMVERTRQRLHQVSPIAVRIGHVLYHPEGIALGLRPAEALDAMFGAVREAAQVAIGTPADAANAAWIPHVTLAYSTAVQPADPIIADLGRELPEREIIIDTVSLIAQRGPERQWDWRPMAEIRLGATAAS